MIKATNLTKYYGLTKALDSFSLEVQKGKVFALLGPNGAGKTTFIKSLLGLVKTEEGTVEFFGESCNQNINLKKNISYLPERFSFHSFYTAKAVLEFYGKMKNIPPIELESRCDEALKKVNMGDLKDRPIKNMSKGQRQRVGIASLLLSSSELIILDEPFSGLDPLGIRDLKKIITELANSGSTIFLNSHILSEVESICDSFGIINKGKLIDFGELKSALDGNTLEEYFYKKLSPVESVTSTNDLDSVSEELQ